MPMTWRELRERINQMSEDQMNTNVTVHDSLADEFYGDVSLELNENDETDVLDENHPFLRF